MMKYATKNHIMPIQPNAAMHTTNKRSWKMGFNINRLSPVAVFVFCLPRIPEFSKYPEDKINDNDS